jgi:hypothetical protein
MMLMEIYKITYGFQANILQPDNILAMIALNCTWQLSDNGLYNALWVLEFLPLQAFPESIYTFSIIWRNETTEIPIPSSPMIVPTIPGSPSPKNMKVPSKFHFHFNTIFSIS